MTKGKILGFAIAPIVYADYILMTPPITAPKIALVVILSALTIVLVYFAFKDTQKK